jgi:amidophosphoribosyltransferase
MAQIGKLIAFQAAIALLNERNMNYIIKETYDTILALKEEGKMHERNVVKDIFAPFTEEEISAKIAQILKPVDFPIEVEIVYQPLENLAKAIPNHRGDWYFSGDYPTPGGTKVSNQAFLYYYEKKDIRAYQMTIF